MAKKYWLMKTEPDVFSIDDLKNNKIEPWDGVRNYQARNFMRDSMKLGDEVLIYHSNAKPPGVAGIGTVHSSPYPDPTAFNKKSKYFDAKSDPDNPKWMLIDIKFKKKFNNYIPLNDLREISGLEEMRILQKGNRLSITPVEKKEFTIISKIGSSKE